MAYFDSSSAESASSLVRSYMAEALEQLHVMSEAGKDCVDNMAQDGVVAKANARLNESLSSIQLNIDLMNNILQGMAKEIEHYREIENYGNSF